MAKLITTPIRQVESPAKSLEPVGQEMADADFHDPADDAELNYPRHSERGRHPRNKRGC